MDFLSSPGTKIDAGIMKQIAVVTMFIDHLTYCFLEVARNAQGERIMNTFEMGKTLDAIGRGIGRLAFPVFCFLIVEGFLHTRNRWKYLVRLLLFAVISQEPFRLMAFPTSQKRHSDVIFTLAAGYVLIWIVETLAKYCGLMEYFPVAAHMSGSGEEEATVPLPLLRIREWSKPVRIAIFLIPSAVATYGICRLCKWAGTDYSYGGVICILILYVLYRLRDLSVLTAWAWITYYNQNELLALTGFWLIRCYNGKRGRQNKYFFYVFYPAHLMLLYLIRRKIFGF